jgi:iron complex outermembrane recepter protein
MKKIIVFIFINSLLIYPQVDTTVGTLQYELETVIIKALRTDRVDLDAPYAVDHLYLEAIKSGGKASTIDEAVFSIPGIFVNDRNNPSFGDRISIRGVGARSSFGVRGIKIMLDNIPLTFADGQSQLNNLDLSSIGEIELIRGPASSLHGNSAGGVLNIRSKIFPDEYLSMQPEIILGSGGFQKFNGRAAVTFNKNNIQINISKLNYDGWRQHSAADNFSLIGISRHRISNALNLSVVLNYYNAPYLLSPGSLNKQTASSDAGSVREIVKMQGSGKRTDQIQAGITAELEINESTNFRNTIFYIDRNLLNPIVGRIIDLQRSAGGFRSELNHRLRNNIFLTAGFDLEFQLDNRKEFVNGGLPQGYTFSDYKNMFDDLAYGNLLIDQDENVFSIGPFVRAEIELSNKISVSLGTRFDHFIFEAVDQNLNDNIDLSGKRIMNNVSPAAGINFRPNNLNKIYLNYSTAFQTPTTSELSNRPDAEGGFNPELLPEKIYSYEIGWKTIGLFNFLQGSASVYYFIMNDMLIPYQISSIQSEEIFFRNAGKADNLGAELQLSGNLISSVAFSLAYTHQRFRFVDYVIETSSGGITSRNQLKGNSIPGIPHNIFSGELIHEFAFGLFERLRVRWTDKYFTNDLNGPAAGAIASQSDYINDSFIRVDFMIGFEKEFNFGKLLTSFGLENIFDKRYNSSIVPNAFGNHFYEPGQGRNYFFKIGFVF